MFHKKMAPIMVALSLFGAVEMVEATVVPDTTVGNGIHLGGADGITPVRNGNDTPVLIEGSDEEALFKALIGKGVDLLKQGDVVSGGVKGLKKYLERLRGAGITADFVNREKRVTVRYAIHNALRDTISAQYHDDASAKIGHVRSGIEFSTTCLDTITDAIRAVALAGNLDEVRSAFTDALNALDESLTGDGGLAKVISDHFAGGRAAEYAEGKSGIVLESHRQAVMRLRTALIGLIHLAVNHVHDLNASTAKMRVFHELYTLMCSSNCGGDEFFNDYDAYDPATPENGNKTLRERYEEWAHKNGVRIPNNKDSLV